MKVNLWFVAKIASWKFIFLHVRLFSTFHVHTFNKWNWKPNCHFPSKVQFEHTHSAYHPLSKDSSRQLYAKQSMHIWNLVFAGAAWVQNVCHWFATAWTSGNTAASVHKEVLAGWKRNCQKHGEAILNILVCMEFCTLLLRWGTCQAKVSFAPKAAAPGLVQSQPNASDQIIAGGFDSLFPRVKAALEGVGHGLGHICGKRRFAAYFVMKNHHFRFHFLH